MITRSKNRLRKGAAHGRVKMDMQTEAWFLQLLQTEGTHSTPLTVTPSELEKWSVFSCIDDLPFSVYVDCSTTGNLQHLSRAKVNAPRALLAHAWQNIQQEFNEAVGGERMSRVATLTAEIEMLNLNIDRVTLLMNAMGQYGPHPDLAHQLREEGFDREYSEESYLEDLRLVEIQAKRFILQRQIKEKEAEGLLPVQKEASNELPTRSTYIRCLVSISKTAKYHIGINDISTREFCIHYRDYIDYVERAKATPTEAEPEEA